MPSARFTRALPSFGGALALVLSAVVVLNGCTTAGPAPQPNPSNLTNPDNSTGEASVVGGSTPVPEQVTCFSERDLASAAPVQPGELWPSAAEERAVAQRFTRHDVPGCAPASPPPVGCDRGAFPWVLSDDRENYAWTGARTVVAGIAAARLAAGSDPSKGNVALEYVLLRFDRNDPARARTSALLTGLVRRCGGGRPGTLGGVKGLVASQQSFFGSGNPDGRGVLVSDGDDLVWLMIDGGAWVSESERRAVGLAARRLRAG
ncbi:MAG: hypothetical protein HOQ21_08960 [Dermatophilaceae bacterium]|nr:hypothetical protein [Dermatophilaceae bacterium]